MGPVQARGVTGGGRGSGRKMTAHGAWSATPSTVDSAGTAVTPRSQLTFSGLMVQGAMVLAVKCFQG